VRFENYLTLSKVMNSGKSRPLPQCWSWGDGPPRFHHLNYDIHSNAFRAQLRQWTDNLYYQLDAGEEDTENARHTSQQQQYSTSYNLQSLPPLRRNISSQLTPVTSQSTERVQGDRQYQYQQNHRTPPTPHNATRHSRDLSQTELLLPAGLLGDDDYFQQQELPDQNQAASLRTFTAVGDRRRGRPSDLLTREYGLFY
jgi:hypothetical protein